MKPWLAVDVKGFGQMMGDKKKTFVVNELAQDAFDEDITCCKVDIHWNNGKVQIAVEDDSPEGFKHIEHAYTLFADTYKRRDPTKRGRFNMGDKNVLAICVNYGAEISTTTGTIEFHPKKGRIDHWSKKRERGSIFKGTFRATKNEYQELLDHAKKLLPPQDITYIVNGEIVPPKPVFKSFPCTLETVMLENDVMKNVRRETTVNLIQSDGQSYIYEMGIPIMQTDCFWHIDVQQKIPLTLDRESVRHSYLRSLYAEVVNNTYLDIPGEEVTAFWVRTGTIDERITKEAMDVLLKRRYGERFLVKTPGDLNANDEAISMGYHLIHGHEMSKKEWDKIREFNLIKSTTDLFGADKVPGKLLKPTAEQQSFADFVKRVAKKCMGINITIRFVDSIASTSADYGGKTLTFNVQRLPKDFFDGIKEDNLDLMIHELGHEAGHHTEQAYHNLITELGAKLTILALREPSFFSIKLKKVEEGEVKGS